MASEYQDTVAVPWSPNRTHVLRSVAVLGGLHACPRLLALALFPAEVTVDRHGATLAPHDRVALPTGRTFNASLLDRHPLAYLALDHCAPHARG
jgi:hypothetical protein